MDRTASIREAKAGLPHLVDLAERGETIVITRHGKVVARLVPPIKEPIMVTTTGYGTWCNRVDSMNVSVEATVADAFGPEGAEGFDFDAIVADYRDAINEALPERVTLSGNEFIGPAHPEDITWGDELDDGYGDLKIKEIVDGVDLQAIIGKHERA